MLFGKSKIKIKKVVFYPTLHALPYIELLPSKQTYWPQTGQEFIYRIFLVTGFEKFVASKNIMVAANNGLFSLKPNDILQYVYKPAHDQHLRETGVQAGRNDILFTRIKGRGRFFNLTNTLYVHRSRTDFDNYFTGAAVFGISFFFFTGWIVLYRQKSTPW